MIYYICSPYRGTPEEIERNVNYARNIAREQLMFGNAVIVPHLYIPGILNDAEPDERKIGLTDGLELLKVCDAVVVGQKYGISEGMLAEIQLAKKMRKPVFYSDREDW